VKGKDELKGLSLAGLIITLGIVYGDIGTSPLYVMKAILGGLSVRTPENIYGALSCIIWTLTLQTTIKYVVITLRADNKGEGGIFALFALIRKRASWVYIFAIIGGSTLLADGIITPSITVTSAIEGINLINSRVPVIPIVLLIITAIFIVQQFGTRLLGKSFGPIMLLWFLMIGILGFIQILAHPGILHSLNPFYAVRFLTEVKGGFILLGAVFLATTGAEALYSDLGHVGLRNIRVSWSFVKTMLVLNYLGQGAWILSIHSQGPSDNPFYAIMPDWFLPTGIVIATAAAIIASQALISGSFTLISEAISLNFWPRQRLSYPTEVKGQVYISSINWFLWTSCVFVVLYFKESSMMEAAYGLSITITMIMTTLLLFNYLKIKKIHGTFIWFFLLVFLTIEGTFLIANLHKFSHGGWFTILIGTLFFIIMYVRYNARKIRNSFLRFVKMEDFLPVLCDLSKDESVPKFATHLAIITKANRWDEIESKIIYSILNRQPKRADVYWFLHSDVVDEPDVFEYAVTHFVPGRIIKVDFRLGFKVEPRINIYFKQVMEDLKASGEVDNISRYGSLKHHDVEGDLKFVIIERVSTYDFDYSFYHQLIISLNQIFRKLGINDVQALGLDTSNVLIEKVPITMEFEKRNRIQRIP
jgi:KUP system potassium uptake protein